MGIIKDVILHDQEAKKQEPSKYDEALAKYNTDLDDNAVREAVRKIIAEKVPQNDTEEVKKFLFGSIELTTLKTTDSETSVLALYRARERLRQRVSRTTPRGYHLRISVLRKDRCRVFGGRRRRDCLR